MFQLDSEADTNGTSLFETLDTVTVEKMEARFGESNGDGVIDAEKGYSGDEWYFTSEQGNVFTVYFRWGQARIGCNDVHNNDEAPAFREWLLSQLAA